MVRGTPLETFPPNFTFPQDLASRIYYDPKAKLLFCQGFMSKSEFDRLSRLSNDYRYQRALETLFQKCTFYEEPPARFPLVKALAALIAVFGVAAAIVGWKWFH